MEFRLTARPRPRRQGAQAVCVFVNDRVDRPCLEALAALGVKLVALRCTGFNNVDLAAAKELGFTVTRVPAYSPYAVAEHAVALLLTLNRKIHRAFNRVRELNFSLNGLVGFDLHGKTAGIVGTGQDRPHRRPDPARLRHARARPSIRSRSASGRGSTAWNTSTPDAAPRERRHLAARTAHARDASTSSAARRSS